MGGQKVSRQPVGCVVIALVATLLAGCASTNQSAEIKRLRARAAYDRALQHVKDKEASPALTAVQEAIALDDSVPVYWNTLGWIYLQLGRPDIAFSPFTKALQLDPAFGLAQENVGVALSELGRWEEAVAAYRKAILMGTVPTPETTYQNMGMALLNLKRYREAEEALRFAISLNPKQEAPYYHLGLVLTAENRRDEARAAFRRVRDLSPQSPFGQAATERLRALGEGG